jgi:hypothetical protein
VFKATSKSVEKHEIADNRTGGIKASTGVDAQAATRDHKNHRTKHGRDIMDIPIRDLMNEDRNMEQEAEKMDGYHSAAAASYLEQNKEKEKERQHPIPSAYSENATTVAKSSETRKVALPADRRAEAKKRLEARRLRQQQGY